MHRGLLVLASIALAFLSSGSHPATAQEVVRGSGTVASQVRNVRNFHAISLHTSGRLIIEETGTESLTIEAEDNLLPYLTSEVRDHRLILSDTSTLELG